MADSLPSLAENPATAPPVAPSGAGHPPGVPAAVKSPSTTRFAEARKGMQYATATAAPANVNLLFMFIFLLLTLVVSDFWLDVQTTTLSFTRLSVSIAILTMPILHDQASISSPLPDIFAHILDMDSQQRPCKYCLNWTLTYQISDMTMDYGTTDHGPRTGGKC